MSGCRMHAWVVLLMTDEDVKGALVTGNLLRKSQTTGMILAVLSCHVSKQFIKDLDKVFDFVIVKDVGEINGSKCSHHRLFLSALSLTSFRQVIVLQPGVMILRQSDHLFDLEKVDQGQLLLNDEGNCALAILQPCQKTYTNAMTHDFSIGLDRLWGQLGITKINRIPTFSTNGNHDDRQLEHTIVWVDPCLLDTFVAQVIGSTQSELLPDLSTNSNEQADWIAIVGMSCRFPGANSIDEYWEILNSGKNCSSGPPENRLSLVEIDENIRANFLKCPIDQFDASFFGISPSEANFLDPQARILLEVSWEAFEDAGIPLDKLKGSSAGVFCGAWLQEYKEAMNASDTDPSEEFFRKYLGNGFGCTAAKLSFFYGFTGPNISTESGCSSSMVAVDLACKSLQRRECPVALAAGTNIILQFNMKKKVVWAEDGKSKTFDAGADGYARAEGIAVIVLKRYSDAIRDGDRIHGIIRGSAASQEGLSKSFGAPTVESEYKAMSGALSAAQVDPSQVDYVEAHATGTSVGDPIEAAAIVKAYSSRSPRTEKLLIGSGKTNIGHAESCSGLAGLIKVILAMKHERIPPHINLTSINPQVNFDPIPGEIPVKAVPWPRKSTPRIAGVSSFGITGTDVHLIVQEPPATTQKSAPASRQPHLQIITMASKSLPALEQLCETYANHLDGMLRKTQQQIQFDNFVYTVNATRTHHHQFRKALLVKDISQAVQLLRQKSSHDKVNNKPCKTDKPPMICFAFPGIISTMDFQYASQLYTVSSQFKYHIDHCNTTWLKLFPAQASLVDTMQAAISLGHQDMAKKPVAFYASYLAVQYALVMLWKSWGMTPTMVLGHCMGELSACLVSGMLTLEDAFKVVACVELFISNEDVLPGAMLAVNCDEIMARNLIDQYLILKGSPTSAVWIDIAGINTPTQTVLAGPPEILKSFQDYCATLENHHILSKFLRVDFAVHSRAIQPAWKKGREILNGIEIRSPNLTYISSVTGEQVTKEDATPEFLFRVFRDCVQFTKACETVKNNLYDKTAVIIELGLGTALAVLMRENLKGDLIKSQHLVLSSLPKKPDIKRDEGALYGLLGSLAEIYLLGGNIDWQGFYKFEEKCRTKVDVPFYPFQRKSFWFERKNVAKPIDAICYENWPSSHIHRVHPLLGSVVPTALENHKIYQNSLREENAPYIYDHVIGPHVIFPAAGFLEMMLAANNLEYGGSSLTSNFVVEDFMVHKPLYLSNSEPRRLQCILDMKTNKCIVYAARQNGASIGNSNWNKFSSGMVSRQELLDEHFKRNVDLPFILNNCVGSQQIIENFYSEAAAVGLNFGPLFRSMKRIFKPEINETLIEVEYLPEEEEHVEKYVAHPILLDAMLQGLILHSKPHLNKLHVPVKIGKLIWFPGNYTRVENDKHSLAQQFYVHCKCEPSGITKTVHLLNKNGAILCEMMQPELAPTTVQSVLLAADVPDPNGSHNSLPTLHQIEWQPSKTLQMKESLELGKISSVTLPHDFLHDQRNAWTEEEQKLEAHINHLCYLYVLKALYDFGWVPVLGKPIPEFQQVVSGLRPALRHYMTYLVGASILEKDSNMLNQLPPNRNDVEREINELLKTKLKDYAPIEIIHACGSQLAAILQGHVTGQYILFGTEKSGNTYAELFYQLTRFNFGMFQEPAKVFLQISQQLWSCCSQLESGKHQNSKCYRILEIGSGTGSFTCEVLDQLEELGINFQYVFTDISPSFFSRAQNKFSRYVSNNRLEFRVLDIEKDPLDQGFPPNYFDAVVGVDVFHATRQLKRTMNNVRKLVKKGGALVIGETELPVRELDICFGILDGYWLQEDIELRPKHCTISSAKWKQLLEEVGFDKRELIDIQTSGGQMSVICVRNMGNDKNMLDIEGEWAIFHNGQQQHKLLQNFKEEMKSVGRRCTSLNVDNLKLSDVNLQNYVKSFMEERREGLEGIIFWSQGDNQLSNPKSQYMLEALLQTSKFLGQCRWKRLPKLHVITEGIWSAHNGGDDLACYPDCALLWGFLRTLRVELPELESKSIDLECSCDSKESKCVINEIWASGDKETEILFRGGVRLVRRLARVEDKIGGTVELEIPCSRYVIELPQSRMMRDLKYIPKIHNCDLEPSQVEIQVKSASLNFKDVLSVMKPSKYFEEAKIIGLDFSGVITAVGGCVTKWKVGDPVFGCNWTEGTITSHLRGDADMLMGVPKHLTFNEAATLPAVFLTAWHCMVNVAGMKAGQRILIHAASGGVGLMAIQLSKYLGLEVFGTAGSERKRNFVKSLGIQHVFNSRTTDYSRQILEITGGVGVDMILNCLTGPGFKEASLDCCKTGGYFVEISKLDIWSVQEVKEERADVNYHIVDVMILEKQMLTDMMSILTKFLVEGIIKPLPYARYAAPNIVDALTFLQKAKQIGKVIVEMPEVDTEDGRMKQLLFNEQSSYLITGGMGAIGLAVAKWMVANGAQTLILVGRSPPNEKANQVISEVMASGATVITRQCDISNYDQCKALFEELRRDAGIPPVRGVHHCSGVLSDRMIMNQDWANFQMVLAPKVGGAYNLHQVTKELALEFFVMYSSMSSTFGNAGQSNYAAANCYMDALVEMRRHMNLPGMSINWGQWNAGLAENLKLDWTDAFSIEQGIKTLEKLMKENRITAVVGNLKFPGVIGLYPKYENTLFENIRNLNKQSSSESHQDNISQIIGTGNEKQVSGPTLSELLQNETLTVEEKTELIQNCVTRLICDLLGISSQDVEVDLPFSDMGMDSLMSIEFTNKLQVEMESVKLGFVDMEEHGTVNGMTSLVLAIFDDEAT